MKLKERMCFLVVSLFAEVVSATHQITCPTELIQAEEENRCGTDQQVAADRSQTEKLNPAGNGLINVVSEVSSATRGACSVKDCSCPSEITMSFAQLNPSQEQKVALPRFQCHVDPSVNRIIFVLSRADLNDGAVGVSAIWK
ncbi:butyrophilin subfamily 2 member A2-like isoform X1, partial [Lates japonicus]